MPTGADYIESVRKYAPNASEACVGKIVRHLGIALQSRDASLVSATDKIELERVREKWLKRKLALEGDDASLDVAIDEICETMKGDRNKCRVVFYYLLAEKFGKLDTL
ncbi:MAG: hypothetical protein CME88_03705 [Hirschia sp.]|nr:hypothetical protein [Hirschia sp.]MBF17462.1 hypothetical protein [Hirschia sp.]